MCALGSPQTIGIRDFSATAGLPGIIRPLHLIHVFTLWTFGPNYLSQIVFSRMIVLWSHFENDLALTMHWNLQISNLSYELIMSISLSLQAIIGHPSWSPCARNIRWSKTLQPRRRWWKIKLPFSRQYFLRPSRLCLGSIADLPVIGRYRIKFVRSPLGSLRNSSL